MKSIFGKFRKQKGKDKKGSVASERRRGPKEEVDGSKSKATKDRERENKEAPSDDGATPKPVSTRREVLKELLEDLPNSLRESKPELRAKIFMHKMNLCCIIFDFNTMEEMESRGIEKKRLVLSELVEHISTHDWFTEESLIKLLSMISSNLFRGLPSNPNKSHENDMDADEEESFSDPLWPHLHLVYECLLRFLLSPNADKKIMQKHLQGDFLLHLIELFESEDMRERDYLKTILHRIYGRFMPLRQPIRKAIKNVCYRYIYDVKTFNGIAEFLDIFSSVIHGFALPIKPEHKAFLGNVLIPLHKSKELEMFHQHLAECVIQFIYKDYRMGPVVIGGLLKYWPVMNPPKETLFLDEMQDAIGEMMNANEFEMELFHPLISPVFSRVAKCIESLNYTVGERALTMWNSDFIRWLCSELRDVIFPIIAPALLRNTTSHWSENVRSLSEDVIDVLKDQDAPLWESMEFNWRRENEQKKLESKLLNRQRRYKIIADMARKNRAASAQQDV